MNIRLPPVDVGFENVQGKGAWVQVIMKEGRKRQIRETCRQLGLPVVRILRIRIGSLRLGNLNQQELSELKGSHAAPKNIAGPKK